MTQPLSLFLISQDENKGYDTYDSAVVVATTEEEARKIHPSGSQNKREWDRFGEWTESINVKVKYLTNYIGKDYENGDVILASYNAG